MKATTIKENIYKGFIQARKNMHRLARHKDALEYRLEVRCLNENEIAEIQNELENIKTTIDQFHSDLILTMIWNEVLAEIKEFNEV